MLLFLFACSLLLPNVSMAWGSAGHTVIATEAYRELSPALKAQVFEILKAHPDFAKWQSAYHPNANFDLAAYVFMRSSTWPDEIRRKGNKYDHPSWHFIDYPLRPPAFAFEPDANPTNNVLFGIAQCEKTLADTNANPELRAVYLSWLVHLIGDLHQPLHCESFFSDAYPKGDKGGNDFFVRPNQAGVRLHGVWDGLLGSTVNPRTQFNYAIELATIFPRKSLSEITKHSTSKEWSLEGRELAIVHGYLRGQLAGGANAETAVALPTGYTKTAKAVAERQAALAGYRLADEIQLHLKMAKPVALLAANTNIMVHAEAPKKIGTAEASSYYDETMVVTGKVVQVIARPTVTLINLDAAAPNTFFSAVIFPENFSHFGDAEHLAQKLVGQNVEISGTIGEYRNKPQIILESTNQVLVLDKK